MKKISAIILAFIVILLFSFVLIKVSSLGSDNNFFNSKIRPQMDKYPILRQIFSLHYDGDGAPDYLGQRYKTINIIIGKMTDIEIDRSVLNRFINEVHGLTGKNVELAESLETFNFSILIDSDAVGKDISKLKKTSHDQVAELYVLYASHSADSISELGVTYQENGIVIFKDAILNFASSSTSTLPNYEYSTLLHEFGHQIGLPHNNIEGCLMNVNAEKDHKVKLNPKDAVVDFCDYEKAQINATRQ